MPCPPNQHMTEVDCRGCGKKKSEGNGQCHHKERREEVPVRKDSQGKWMEGAGQPWNRMIPVHIALIEGLNLLYWLSENTRAAGAYSRAGHRWAALDTEFCAAVSSLPRVPCSNRGTWRVQRWVVRMLLGRWASSHFRSLELHFLNTCFQFQ